MNKKCKQCDSEFDPKSTNRIKIEIRLKMGEMPKVIWICSMPCFKLFAKKVVEVNA